jgi:hypothetical protein
MIVTCDSGRIYTIGPAGGNITTTPLANLNTFIENPGVAHPNFGACGGCVFVASETTGNIFAVRPNGTVFGGGAVANLSMAEAIHPIPPNVCNFGTSGGAFFTAIFSGVESPGVYQFPKSAFTVGGQPLNGNILVTSEDPDTGISVLKPSGTGYALTPWHGAVGQNEGGDFCARLTLPPGQVKLNGAFNPTKNGKYKLRFFSSVALNFYPLQIDTDTLRSGRIGNEDSLSHCTLPGDVNGDTHPELDCHFFHSLAGFPPSAQKVRRVFWSAFTQGSVQEDPPLDGFGD